MDGRSVLKVLLVVLFAMGYLGWHRWTAMQRDASLKNLKVADNGVTVVHFYADW